MLCNEVCLEFGMECFLEKGGFKVFINCFEDLLGFFGFLGFVIQCLMLKGYGYGGEGDWKIVVMVCIMKVMGEGCEGGCLFMEDYIYNMGEID